MEKQEKSEKQKPSSSAQLSTANLSHESHSLIIKEIYLEKLEYISTKVTAWSEEKFRFLSESLQTPVLGIYEKVKSSQAEFELIMHELLKIVSMEHHIFSKIKREESSVPARPNTGADKSKQIEVFTKCLKKVTETRSGMFQLGEFCSRFFAITSNELNDMKTFYSQIQNAKQRYLRDSTTKKQSEKIITNAICSKNVRKYFEISKVSDLKAHFAKHFEFCYAQLNVCFQYQRQELEKKRQIYQNCMDNIQYFNNLYVKVFSVSLTEQVRQFLMKKIAEINRECAELEKQTNQNGIRHKEEAHILDKYQILCKSVDECFLAFMEDITVAEWKVIYFGQSPRKSSFSFLSTLQGNQEESSKSSAVVQAEQSFHFHMTLTVDYKIIFRKMGEPVLIEKEILLNDVKVEVLTKEQRVSLKDRKTKEKYYVKFFDEEKVEELLLHLQRFRELKKQSV